MNKEIDNKLQRGLALTVKESRDLYKYIKALEQEPCEDAISRADVKKYLSAPDANGDRVIYESDLELLPSVTPQLKIGQWIDDKCSVCGKGIEDLIASPEWYRDEEPNFCPFCGIKIQEMEE